MLEKTRLNETFNFVGSQTHSGELAQSDRCEGECLDSVNSIAFIKTHKTGSTTIGHIMNRFGFQRNLSFVLNKKSSNGHLVYTKITKDSPKNLFLKPLDVKKGDYERYKYDMITVHVRYFRKAMDTFMKPGTRYITILRYPGTQFESAFVHFQMDDAFPILVKNRLKSASINDRLKEWFKHPKQYLEKLKQLKWEGQVGLRYYYAQNNQLFDLGLDVRYHNNETMIRDYIAKLDEELDMVLITEYIEESLLVMKKQFSWQLEDILFVPKNQRTEQAKLGEISQSLRHKIDNWNGLDVRLYQHFNESLWRKVKEYGPNFDQDLANYRERLADTFDRCTEGTYVFRQGRYFQNINYKPAKDSDQLCMLIAEHKRNLMKRVRTKQVNG